MNLQTSFVEPFIQFIKDGFIWITCVYDAQKYSICIALLLFSQVAYSIGYSANRIGLKGIKLCFAF